MKHKLPNPFAANDRLAFQITEAGQIVGIGRTSVYELIREGKLKTVKIAGRTLIPADSLRALVDSKAA